MHRVRLLRAALPQPRPHPHAAPADRRSAARWPGSAGRSPGRNCSAQLEREFQYSARSTPVPPTGCAPPAARWASTPGCWSSTCATRRTPGGGGRLARSMARHFGAVEKAARGGLRLAHLTRAIVGQRGAAGLTRAARTLGIEVPLDFTDLPRAARHDLPRTARDGARAVYLPSCVSRTLGARRGRPLPRGGRGGGVRARRRAGVDPGRRLRPLLRHAVRLQGLQGGGGGGGQPLRRGDLGVDGRRPPAGGPGHQSLRPHPPRMRARAGPGPPWAARAAGDARWGPVRAEARRAPPGGPPPPGCRRAAPGVLDGEDGHRRAASQGGRAVHPRGRRPAERGLLRLRRRPWLPGARAHRRRHVRGGPGGSLSGVRGLLLVEPHVRDRACPGPPESPTAPSGTSSTKRADPSRADSSMRRRVGPIAALLLPLVLGSAGAAAASFDWESATPESQGLSKAKLLALQEALEGRGTRGFLVIRNDRIVFEWYAPGHGRDRPHYTASMAKALVGGVSLAVAMTDGRLSLDDSVAEHVPEWRRDPAKARITLRHLGSHTSGLQDAWVAAEAARGVEQRTSRAGRASSGAGAAGSSRHPGTPSPCRGTPHRFCSSPGRTTPTATPDWPCSATR